MTDRNFSLEDGKIAVRFNRDFVRPRDVIPGITAALNDKNLHVAEERIEVDAETGMIFFPVEPVPVAGDREPALQPVSLPFNIRSSTGAALAAIDMLIPQPGSSPGPSTTGGPGSVPQAPLGDCGDADMDFFAPDVRLVDDQNNPIAPMPGRVNVFVLDTSPFPENHNTRLQNRLNDFNNGNEIFPFIRHFVRMGGGLEPIEIEEVSVGEVLGRSPNPVQSMSNHGIFIASIIKTIAPEANVRIVPVMSSEGEGQLSTVISTLQRLRNDGILAGSQVLVNISANARFLFSTETVEVLEGAVLNALAIAAPDGEVPDLPSYVEAQLEEMQGLPSSIRNEVVAFAAENRRIIAAAGNDWTTSREPPWPKFPAYMKGVMSVGAVRADGMRTDYSNLPQIPQFEGIQGFLDGLNIVSGNGIYAYGGTATGGLRGLFINDFVDLATGGVIPNRCGIAHWAGTSFATAVVTGYMAWLCLRGQTAREAEETLRTNLPTTGDGVPRLMVQQQPVQV